MQPVWTLTLALRHTFLPMPFRIHVDPARRLGMAQVSGQATGADLFAANEALYSHPDWEAGFDELWDCRSIQEFVIDVGEMQALATMEIEGQEQIGSGRVVLVITREVIAMMGNLYRALVQESGRPVEVTRTLDAGATWLGHDGVPSWFSESGEAIR